MKNEQPLTRIVGGKFYSLQKDGSYSRSEAVASRLQDSKPKCHAGGSLDHSPSNEGRCVPGIILRIKRCSTRLLDLDNGTGGCKAIIDQLRYENLITNDSPEDIDFRFSQQKVETKEEEGTEIVIEMI